MPRNPELESAALANPGDRDAWRVYADWLQAQGDPRGELIGLAMLEPDAFMSERKQMRKQLEAGERELRAAWASWADARGIAELELEIRHGLVEQIAVPLPAALPHLDALFEAAPLRRLVLREVTEASMLELLSTAPTWLAQLEYLKLERAALLEQPCWTALASVPLPALDGLNLCAQELGNEGCEALRGLQTTHLRRLVLTANEIDDDGLAALLECEARSQWRKLYLSNNPLDDAAGALAGATGLAGLEELYLRDVAGELSGMEVLGDPSVLPGLRVLEASAGWRANQGTIAALRARFGSGLRLR